MFVNFLKITTQFVSFFLWLYPENHWTDINVTFHDQLDFRLHFYGQYCTSGKIQKIIIFLASGNFPIKSHSVKLLGLGIL